MVVIFELGSLLENIIEVQLVVVDANPQGGDEVAPAEERIVQVEITQHIQIPAFVKPADLRMKRPNFGFQHFLRNRFVRVVARSPQEAHPLWELWTAVQVLDLDPIRAIASQTSVPAETLPHPLDGGEKGLKQQAVVIDDLADAPFPGSRSLPKLGVGQAVQRVEGGFTLRVEKVKVSL